ncbi:MAG TPA: general secretion pathway protein GspE [Cyanobacteria bacterium UBA11149]|nr:general secretion pathway protein GspE [Cyanobacteria bacterium UBA11367]HBE56163.1 general secretion pathway protein GspE [Cyanobacteria bacterium UBA11366]HBK62184.1 general secretion pathway protein GspE [Cyanobacteria bacterium UBA11166]HBR73907.1 general secretion pathway protein GspE [Cyanobacteria bacterium UBA11159]HBS70208.1 general secretion pathway protein GspE [Cyanobacteria bacterium UBA11153]HBW90841.1 general secretion pathway protein GspE [Cyanobacteria bacterium UBA11149]H
MAISNFFSAIAKILIQSGYINNQQLEQAITLFLEEDKSITPTVSRRGKPSANDRALAFIKNLEAVTKRQLPSNLQRHVIIYFYPFPPFAKKLIQAGYIDAPQMEQALAESRKSNKPLLEVLESLTRKQIPPDLQRQYRKYQLFELKIIYSVEYLDPEISDISPCLVSELIDCLIPIDICRRYRLVPVEKTDNPLSVLVAMVDPDNLDAQDDLHRILRPQNIGLRRIVITPENYNQVISEYLDKKVAKIKEEEERKATDILNDLQNLDSADDLPYAPDEMEIDLSQALTYNDGDPIINLVNKILAKALQEKVSDIHIEPQQECLRVRFRKDGVLQQAFDPLPKKTGEAVASRFKVMAGLDITQRRISQNGRIMGMFNGCKINFRVTILPTRYGEKVVVHILDISSIYLGLNILITERDTLEIVRKMAISNDGLLLVTGPSNSGITTTLYSILAERNDPGVNISTIEDPIEHSLPGITQVGVLREKGLDYASILRSLMWQDVDIILVNETRDKETATTVIEAALKGYFVVSTISSKDAASTIPNLRIMGIESFLIADALTGVIAQRLMRRVCSECRIAYQPTPAELAKFGLSAFGKVTFYKANCLTTSEIKKASAKATLCQKCNGIGYKGRVGVYEVMPVTGRIKSLISKNADTQEIKKAAIEEGMTTLFSYSLKLVAQGYTTMEEVERVTYRDEGLKTELMAQRQKFPRGDSSPHPEKQIESSSPKEQLLVLEKQLATLTSQIQVLKNQIDKSDGINKSPKPLFDEELEDLW